VNHVGSLAYRAVAHDRRDWSSCHRRPTTHGERAKCAKGHGGAPYQPNILARGAWSARLPKADGEDG
jgi:hypothetical protein